MKPKPVKRVPVLIAFGVITLVCLVRYLNWDIFERFEAITYDMRVREALRFSPPVATNLGFVFIDETSIAFVRTNTTLGYRHGLYWPRHVYGRLVQELSDQGAKAVAFDIIFGELRPDPLVPLVDGTYIESDDFFAAQMHLASNVIIAATKEVIPPRLFFTNALAAGEVSTDKVSSDSDSDGILRRAKAFTIYTNWHRAFRQVEEDPAFGVDLRKARVERGQILLPQEGEAFTSADVIKVPLDQDGNFDLADFARDSLPEGSPRKDKPFTEQRIWHMGIVLAAQELKLDLDHPGIDLAKGRVTLHGPGNIKRVIPVDRHGYFYIDWCMPPNHPQLTEEPIQKLLLEARWRLDGRTNDLSIVWRDKLVVVGSAAVGNDLTDRGATPLSRDTLLVSEHWNVANSLLTSRFIRRAPLAIELGLMVLLGIIAALVTWELRALVAFTLVASMAVVYVILGMVLYVQARLWIPLVLPVAGALTTTHLCLLAWRVVFEQAERRRVKSIFSKMVSPKIVNELLAAETLALGGARREITVLFADVRGFTELTDSSQERVAEFVRQANLSGPAAEACFDEQARETLYTVNLYLSLIADIIKKQDGTFDKFIGDCVMAFWGAPTPNPRHALACVHTAIEAQRAIYQLNQQRATENEARQAQTPARLSAGLTPLAPLPLLLLGTGINTGLATAGLMGSIAAADAESLNYTVFGREVNLASRLEGASGRGRIFISETTYQHLLRDDPALAATCVALEPIKVKGFRTAVAVYEVPWRLTETRPLDEAPLARPTAAPA